MTATIRAIALSIIATAIGAGAVGAVGAASPTLDAVHAHETVRCGVHPGLTGFSEPQPDGSYRGFDADLCAAVAAAVLGDPAAVTWVPVAAADRQAALGDGSIDLLSRNTTWTLDREATWGTFVATTFYDGQTVLVPTDVPATTLADLAGRTICALEGTSSIETIGTALAHAGIEATVRAEPTIGQAVADYEAGTCEGITSDRSQLAAIRSTLAAPHDHELTPFLLTREPLGPVVPNGDPSWASVVRWVVFALILAEEHDLNARSVDQALPGSDPEVRRLLGVDDDPAASLGLTPGWARRAIAAVGSYGELYDRWLGPTTPLGLDRGLNALWSDGGLLYAPPFR